MGVIDMVNGKLCETLPIEEIEQIRNEGYQQGRADYAKEISANFDEMDRTAYRMGRADGIMQGKADALAEVKSKMISFHTDKVFQYGTDIIEARADAFDELKDWLEKYMKG